MPLKNFCNEDSSCTSVESDSDIKEIFSSSSYDRSSIGSIPWAEDAIKQNQQEWERIERMFYGEEELPSQEADLRNEILEWRQVFPHLRINGTKLNVSRIKSDLKSNQNISREDFEEIFAVHPSNNTFKTKTLADGYFGQNELSKDAVRERILIEELEKNLRISSVPVVPRERVLIRTHTQSIRNKEDTRPLFNLYRSEMKEKRLNQSQSRSIVLPGRLNSNDTKLSSNSATILRMPPIMHVIDPQKNYYMHSSNKQEKSLTKSKSGKSIVLPAIDAFKFPSDKNLNRSISAAITHRTPNYLLSRSASKLKSLK